MRASHLVLTLTALATLSACGGRERDITLHELRTNDGRPEEFAIVPVKPLQQPESYDALPAPVPGAQNRTDQTPLSDAVAALGGNPARLDPRAGVPSSDAALVRSASRFGRDPQIRAALAAEDLEFRKRRSLFSWTLVPEDQYYRAYRRQSLDPYDWLERFRRAGDRTPSAPPER